MTTQLGSAPLSSKGGAVIDSHDFAGYSPLAYAAKYGSVPALEALITAGATPHGRIGAPTDRDGKPAYNPTPWAVAATPLILAAAWGQAQTVTALLQHKADINATTALGVTALRMAVAGGDPKMVALLLENRADLRATAPQAPAPLNLSVRDGRSLSKVLLCTFESLMKPSPENGGRPRSAAREWLFRYRTVK
jgi:ankyrin repeat protein